MSEFDLPPFRTMVSEHIFREKTICESVMDEYDGNGLYGRWKGYKYSFYQCDFTEDGAMVFSRILQENRHLMHIIFWKCNIPDSAFAIIMEAFFLNCRVIKLEIDETIHTDAQAQILASALRENKMLRVLALSQNGFGDLGATAISESLVAHPTIREFFFTGWRITEVGVGAIANIVRQTTHMKIITVYTIAGAYMPLLEAYEANPSLRLLEIHGLALLHGKPEWARRLYKLQMKRNPYGIRRGKYDL